MICCDTEHKLSENFAKGYRLLLTFNQPPSNLNQVLSENIASFADLEFTIENAGDNTAEVNLKMTHASLATVISRLAAMKQNRIICSFGISRTTMEQLFLDLAHDKDDQNEPKKSKFGLFRFWRSQKDKA